MVRLEDPVGKMVSVGIDGAIMGRQTFKDSTFPVAIRMCLFVPPAYLFCSDVMHEMTEGCFEGIYFHLHKHLHGLQRPPTFMDIHTLG